MSTDGKLDDQVLRIDRMASIGALASGVAHEINNPLAALLANLEFLAQDLTRLKGAVGADVRRRLDELDEPLRDAQESADRVKHIVRDLKVFARADEREVTPIDVNRVVEASIRLARNEIRHRARLVRAFGDVPPVAANEARLGQVFLHLLRNAAQAMPDGEAHRHEIRVATRCLDDGSPVVEIADSGPGMPADVLARAFDAHFSTRPEAPGLGLSICRQIVGELRGDVHLSSEPGRGTVARVVLPRAAPTGRAVPRTPSRSARLLLVDDEPRLGPALCRQLPEHTVEYATGATEALARLGGGQRYDVILCDVMMPNVGGAAFLAAVQAIDPAQAARIVLITGEAYSPEARALLTTTPHRRLEKPFDAATLRDLIADVIDG